MVGCIAALLLAAGESTRMGEPKPLLPWHGRTLLEHQVLALLSAGISRAVAVLGHESERLTPLLANRQRVQCVYNPDYAQGRSTSVKAGIRALFNAQEGSTGSSIEDALLVLSVDQPRSAATIRRIMELHCAPSAPHENGPPARPWLITIPTYRDKGHDEAGHPVILSTALIDELMQISEDTLGLKAVVRRHEEETQRVPMDSPEVLLDLNTPEDYRSALKMFGSG